MSLYRNFFSVSAMTLLSRIFGFVRDIMMANVLGAGPAADAFFAAFRFPNLFRRLFAEGAFNTAFVPVFSKSLEQDGPEKAKELASRIISWLFFILLGVTILAEIFMEQMLVPFVPGFLDDPAKFELTVYLTRICFPYLACMSLMAAYGAILNSLGKFTAVAFAPVLLNIATIIVLIGLVFYKNDNPEFNAFWVSIGIMAGGIVQLATVAWALWRTGMMPKFTLPKIDAEIKHFWMLAIPVVIAGGINQINSFVGTVIASGADSAISYLYFADRLYQLPLGIIGIAISVVLLPELSRHLKGGRIQEAASSQNNALLISMILTMPAAVALIALANPIMTVLFERGSFTALASYESSNALIAFSFGLPAFVLVRVLQTSFFANEDMKTPTILAFISVALNIAISLILFPSIQHVGIAIASTIAAWVDVLMLGYVLAKRNLFALSSRQWFAQLKIFIVSCIMGLALWLVATQIAPSFLPSAGTLSQLLTLSCVIVFGVIVYFTLIHISGVQKLGTIVSRLRRKS